MNRSHRARGVLAVLAVIAVATASLSAGSGTSADGVAEPPPVRQDWTATGLITTNDDWSGVPGIIGYRGDDVTAATGVDPQTLLTEGTAVVDVNADQSNPDTFGTGGVTEFAIADPVVALQGSGTADAPNLVVNLTTAGFTDITVGYVLRDIDASTDDAAQPVALQYRVGATGPFTNVAAAFVLDATSGPSLATRVSPVAVPLPADAAGQMLVQVRIITSNAVGNDEWVGVDDIAITGTPGGGPPGPVATCPATVTTATGRPVAVEVSATDADSAIAAVTVTSPPVDGISLGPSAGGVARLEVAGTTVVGTHDITIEFATDDVPAQLTTCTVAVSVLAITRISTVQGSGAASPLLGDQVAVQAIATSVFTTDDVVSGFFGQSRPGDDDRNVATSEGIFVDCGAACPDGLDAGDLVQVVGVVAEDFAMTRLVATSPGAITTVSQGHPLPAATFIDLPLSGPTNRAATLEPVEGMVTTFTDVLTVIETFDLARFGEVALIEGDRPYQYTHVAEPDDVAYVSYLAEQATRRIVLDDDNDDSNDAIFNGPGLPDEPYPYPAAGLSTTNRLRSGDTISELTGVMEWAFGAWRVRPISSGDYRFTSTSAPPAAPDAVPDGGLRIASFNVLNYFTTIDETAGGTGPCGPTEGMDCRGADSPTELARQRDKIVAAMVAMDADVVGLIELQNDAGAAVDDLVAALDAAGAGPYRAIRTGVIGTDAIKVAFIYRPSAVTPLGAFQILDSTVDPEFIDTRNRPALVQTFVENATGERFTAAINHFKSKGSACIPPGSPGINDPDLGDGQGNCSVTRTKAAEALADFLATDPTGSGDPDVIILGDLNSYRREDPITTLVGAGYTDLVKEFIGDDAYSYLFDGQLGYLDHALASVSLTAQVVGAAEWHVNADEQVLHDYNDTTRTTGEADFEEESDALPLYEPDARRSSDHDPVVVDLDLSSLHVDDAVIVQRARGGGSLAFTGRVDGTFTACPKLIMSVDGVDVFDAVTIRLGRTNVCISLTGKGIVTFDLSTGRVVAVLTLPSSFRLTDDTVTFDVAVDGVPHVEERAGRRTGLVWTTI